MNDVKIDMKTVYLAPTLRLPPEWVRENHPRAFNALMKMSSLPVSIRRKYCLAEDIFEEYLFMQENNKLYMSSLTNPYAIFVYDDRGAWLPVSIDATSWYKTTLS